MHKNKRRPFSYWRGGNKSANHKPGGPASYTQPLSTNFVAGGAMM